MKVAAPSPRLSDPGKGKCVAIQIEGELARPLWSIVNAVGSALDATLPIFVGFLVEAAQSD